MPELPLVEKIRKEAQALSAGRKIVSVAVQRDPIMMKGLDPQRLKRALSGARVIAWHRRGKYLWCEFNRRPWLLVHFGMTGSIVFYRKAAARPRHWKLELEFDNGLRMAVEDARRFGRIQLVNDPAREAPVLHLGYDPLLDKIPAREFVARLRARRAPVKAVLLDQSFAAGVGNWIADEILYQSRVSPKRRAHTLRDVEAQLILKKMIAITRWAVKVNNDEAFYPKSWLFHYRWGDVKTFNALEIRRETVGGRTTAWLPKRQR